MKKWSVTDDRINRWTDGWMDRPTNRQSGVLLYNILPDTYEYILIKYTNQSNQKDMPSKVYFLCLILPSASFHDNSTFVWSLTHLFSMSNKFRYETEIVIYN